MPKMKKILWLVNEASKRAARIQDLAASMGTTPEQALDKYNADLLSAHLAIAIDSLRDAQQMASYMFRPIKETSRLWKNGSGQYETTAGILFREGSPIEVLVPDKDHPGSSHWERTYLLYDGGDYYLAGNADISLNGLGVRVREGDQP